MGNLLHQTTGSAATATAACLLLAACLTPALAWRAFDSFDAPQQRPFGDYFQPSPMMQHIYANQPLNLAPFQSNQQQQPAQLLTPVGTAATAGQGGPQFSGGAAASLQQEQTAPRPSNQAEAQQEFAKQEPGPQQQQAPAMQQRHQLDAREAPPQQQQQQLGTSSPVGEQVGPPTISSPPATESLSGRDISQVKAATAATGVEFPGAGAQAPAPVKSEARDELRQQQPSPLGKILDAAAAAAYQANSTSGKPEVSVGKISYQSLRPLKAGGARKQSTPAAIEQQIIDQHARAAAGYNAHSSQYQTSASSEGAQQASSHQQQRPRPSPATKKRGDTGASTNGMLGSLLLNSLSAFAGSPPLQAAADSSSSNGDNQSSSSSSSSLSTIVNNFKSGISSRSSIMKAAISDNKLARSKLAHWAQWAPKVNSPATRSQSNRAVTHPNRHPNSIAALAAPEQRSQTSARRWAATSTLPAPALRPPWPRSA